MPETRVGTCSLCGGSVVGVRGAWWSVSPPPPDKCQNCGAVSASDVIKMHRFPHDTALDANRETDNVPAPQPPSDEAVAWLREIATKTAEVLRLCQIASANVPPLGSDVRNARCAADLLRFVEGRDNAR